MTTGTLLGLLGVFFFLVVLGIVCAERSHAQNTQWVDVRDFRGITTHRSSAKLGLSDARSSIGWLYRGGQLIRETFDQQTTTVHDGTPLHFLGQSRSDSSVLFVGQDLFRLYGGVQTNVTLASVAGSGDGYDSVVTYFGDSLIRSWEHLKGWDEELHQKWLHYVLTNRGSYRIDGTSKAVRHFYSNVWVLLADTADSPTGDGGSTGDTLTSTVSISIDATAGTGTVEFWSDANGGAGGDTTLLFDGRYLWHYASGTVSDVTTETFTPPTYLDSGTVDSVTEHGDTVNFWSADFDSDVAGTWILWDDTTEAYGPKAQPCSVYALYDEGTGDERISVAVDSTMYAGVDHYHPGMNYVTYQPGARVNVSGEDLFTFTATTLGWYDNLHYTKLTLSNNGWSDLAAAGERYTDCNIWEVAYFFELAQVKCIQQGGNTVEFLAWSRTEQTFNTDNGYSFFYRPLLSWSSSQTSPATFAYRFSVTHRRRAWYAGDPAKPMTYAWSDVNLYETNISSNEETLEGNDPITALSSLGQQFVLYRRRSIEYVLGFSESDFYKVPAPSGVGAVNHYTVSRNPRDNADYFPNEIGLWSYDGGGVRPVAVHVREVFTDSINWDAESAMRGVVWDNKYWLSCPFGSDTVNTRLVVFDLETGDVSFLAPFNVSSMWVYRGTEGDEKLYLGCQDSTVIWLAASTDDVYELADWRSGWSDLGNRQMHKLISEYAVDYESTSGDSLFIDFYTNGTTTAVWSDTIVSSASGFVTHNAGVSSVVQGHSLSIGFRSPDETMMVVSAAVNVAQMGKGRLQ